MTETKRHADGHWPACPIATDNPECTCPPASGRDWLTMADPREFDTSVTETQAALFPEPSRMPGEVALFGDEFGQDLV